MSTQNIYPNYPRLSRSDMEEINDMRTKAMDMERTYYKTCCFLAVHGLYNKYQDFVLEKAYPGGWKEAYEVKFKSYIKPNDDWKGPVISADKEMLRLYARVDSFLKYGSLDGYLDAMTDLLQESLDTNLDEKGQDDQVVVVHSILEIMKFFRDLSSSWEYISKRKDTKDITSIFFTPESTQ